MPYIPKKRREDLWNSSPQNSGELNYIITDEILNYLGVHDGKQPHYADYNEVIGVLECCKLEIYRRLISKYEDKKCKENSDVF